MLIALSLAIPYLIGLGLLAGAVAPALFNTPPATKQEAAQLFACILAAGISLNYAVVLVFEGLHVSLLICSVLSLSGYFLAVRARGSGFLKSFDTGWVIGGATVYLTALFSFSVLLLPLTDWDSWAIWFFHGKMIYYTGALNQAAGWDNAFSHPDYPKLVPVMAAQFAYVAGYWNEYLPKASLLVLFVTAVLGVFSFFDKLRVGFVYLVAMFLFIGGQYMWDGYMDGYLALYAGLSLLFLCRWLLDGRPLDMLSGFLFLAVTLNLKNEGMLYAVAVLASLAASFALRRKNPLYNSFPRWSYWLLLAAPVAGYCLWTFKKLKWGLDNDLKLGSGSIHRIAERLSEGFLIAVGKALLVNSLVAWAALVFLMAAAAARYFRVRLTPPVGLALLVAVIYSSGMLVILLSTPSDLAWHLKTTYNRIMLPTLICIFSATFFTLREIESR